MKRSPKQNDCDNYSDDDVPETEGAASSADPSLLSTYKIDDYSDDSEDAPASAAEPSLLSALESKKLADYPDDREDLPASAAVPSLLSTLGNLASAAFSALRSFSRPRRALEQTTDDRDNIAQSPAKRLAVGAASSALVPAGRSLSNSAILRLPEDILIMLMGLTAEDDKIPYKLRQVCKDFKNAVEKLSILRYNAARPAAHHFREETSHALSKAQRHNIVNLVWDNRRNREVVALMTFLVEELHSQHPNNSYVQKLMDHFKLSQDTRAAASFMLLERLIEKLHEMLLRRYQPNNQRQNIGRSISVNTLPASLVAGWDQCESLTVCDNKLTSLPENIDRMQQLDELDLSVNSLSRLPGQFANLTNLVTLRLNVNRFSEFPSEITALPALKRLILSHNKINGVPAGISNLSGLEVLDLSGNTIASLPREIGSLTNLRDLDLGYNALAELPPEIGDLPHLEKLDLSDNELRELPEELSNLPETAEISVFGNLLDDVPESFNVMFKNRQFGCSREELLENQRREDGEALESDSSMSACSP